MALSQLVYDRAGQGDPLVLIHGIGHRRQAWQPIFHRLAEQYDVIAVDLAGFGESPAYAKGVAYTMEHARQDLADNFAAWGISRPHVVGNSLGGAIALELGAADLVSSVTALSPAGFFGPLDRIQPLGLLSFLRLASRLPDFVLRAVSRRAVGRWLIGSLLYSHWERIDADTTYADALALKHATGFGRTIKAGLRYHFDSPVQVPTTVAWGTKDRILPYRQSRRARRILPNANHVDLTGSGHVPMVDDPDLIISFINETIERARAARAA